MKYLVFVAIIAAFLASAQGFTLYTGGNSWSLGKGSVPSTNFTFTSLPTKFATYFYTDSSGALFNLSILMNCSVATTVKVTIGDTNRSVNVSANNNFAPVMVGSLFSYSGYNQIITDITAFSTGSGTVFNFNISDTLTNLAYVPNNTGNNFYWGRRGSSASISMNISGANNINYFYSEIYVPKGFDPVGSYYMANGFSQGYMGIQVNSLT
jgi:hypothetical protein